MGGGGIIIIRSKLVKDALSVGLNKTGSAKLWHALLATHIIVFLVGLAF